MTCATVHLTLIPTPPRLITTCRYHTTTTTLPAYPPFATLAPGRLHPFLTLCPALICSTPFTTTRLTPRLLPLISPTPMHAYRMRNAPLRTPAVGRPHTWTFFFCLHRFRLRLPTDTYRFLRYHKRLRFTGGRHALLRWTPARTSPRPTLRTDDSCSYRHLHHHHRAFVLTPTYPPAHTTYRHAGLRFTDGGRDASPPRHYTLDHTATPTPHSRLRLLLLPPFPAWDLRYHHTAHGLPTPTPPATLLLPPTCGCTPSTTVVARTPATPAVVV